MQPFSGRPLPSLRLGLCFDFGARREFRWSPPMPWGPILGARGLLDPKAEIQTQGPSTSP